MAMQNYTKHQQGIINRYYENRDTLMLQKLQELATELYLAEGEAAKKKLWDRVQKAMANLKIPAEVVTQILSKRSPECLAAKIQEWLKPPGKK